MCCLPTCHIIIQLRGAIYLSHCSMQTSRKHLLGIDSDYRCDTHGDTKLFSMPRSTCSACFNDGMHCCDVQVYPYAVIFSPLMQCYYERDFTIWIVAYKTIIKWRADWWWDIHEKIKLVCFLQFDLHTPSPRSTASVSCYSTAHGSAGHWYWYHSLLICSCQ